MKPNTLLYYILIPIETAEQYKSASPIV